MVVPQQSAEPLTTFDVAFGPTDVFSRFQDRVPEPLVISLTVIVVEIAPYCSTKHVFAKEGHPR